MATKAIATFLRTSPIQKILSTSKACAHVMSARRTRPAMPRVWMQTAELNSPAAKIAGTLASDRRGSRSTMKPHSPAASGKPSR